MFFERAAVQNERSILQTVMGRSMGRLVVRSSTDAVQSILPDKQPLQTSVTDGTRTLALDTSGKLFLSRKPGKRWKAVHGPWKKSGVTSLSLAADQSFRVTTAQGSWLSTDGEHWRSTN